MKTKEKNQFPIVGIKQGRNELNRIDKHDGVWVGQKIKTFSRKNLKSKSF